MEDCKLSIFFSIRNSILMVAFACLLPNECNAQEMANTPSNPAPIVYVYDASGNRIRRSPLNTQAHSPKKQDEKNPRHSGGLLENEISVSLDANSNIKVEILGKDELSDATIGIYNAAGILLSEISPVGGSTVIKTAGYKDGVYIVVVSLKDESHTWKCVIERR